MLTAFNRHSLVPFLAGPVGERSLRYENDGGARHTFKESRFVDWFAEDAEILNDQTVRIIAVPFYS